MPTKVTRPGSASTSFRPRSTTSGGGGSSPAIIFLKKSRPLSWRRISKRPDGEVVSGMMSGRPELHNYVMADLKVRTTVWRTWRCALRYGGPQAQNLRALHRELIAENAVQNLADRTHRQRLADLDVLRHLVGRERGPAMRDQVLLGR